MNQKLTTEFVDNIFNKYLFDNNIPKPVLWFVNGHKSHTGLETAEKCREKNIIIPELHSSSATLRRFFVQTTKDGLEKRKSPMEQPTPRRNFQACSFCSRA